MTNNTLKVPNKFWIFLVGVVITGIIAFIRLQEQVNAIEHEFEKDSVVLQEVHESVIRIEKDIEFIKEGI